MNKIVSLIVLGFSLNAYADVHIYGYSSDIKCDSGKSWTDPIQCLATITLRQDVEIANLIGMEKTEKLHKMTSKFCSAKATSDKQGIAHIVEIEMSIATCTVEQKDLLIEQLRAL